MSTIHLDNPKIVTAPTAQILFDGFPIGAVQDINVSIDYNAVEVDQLGSGTPAQILPGIMRVGGEARRAYISTDFFFSQLTAGLNQEGIVDLSQLLGINNISISGVGSVAESAAISAGTSLAASAITSLLTSVIKKAVPGTSSNQITTASVSSILTSQLMNILLAESIYFSILIEDEAQNIVTRIDDAVLTSRRIRMTLGNIILLNEIAFKARVAL